MAKRLVLQIKLINQDKENKCFETKAIYSPERCIFDMLIKPEYAKQLDLTEMEKVDFDDGTAIVPATVYDICTIEYNGTSGLVNVASIEKIAHNFIFNSGLMHLGKYIVDGKIVNGEVLY